MFIFERSGLILSATLLLVLAGCTGDEGMGMMMPPPDGLEPPPAGEGFQLSLTASIAAGDEHEFCKFVRGPAEELYLYADQVAFTRGSHHFLLYQTEYTEIPTAKEDGTPVDTSGVFDCSDGPTNGWSVTRVIAGTQSGDGVRNDRYPEGIGLHVPANSILMMNAHYVNSTEAALTPEVRINVYTRPPSEITTEGDVLFLYNPFIHVPANGTSRARWRCPVHTDITLTQMQSHMHVRGMGYEAGLVGEEPFYLNTDWENVPIEKFGGVGMNIPAGSTLDYFCDYENPEDREVYQGPRTTDEMCMMVGNFYPADPNTARCRLEDGGLGGEWVGNGTATCAATLDCMLTAFEAPELIKAIGDCMLGADPAKSAMTSGLLRCFANSDDPMTQCTTEIDTCMAN